MPELQVARLIPVSGIDTVTEAETRATSALLSVMSIVRPFSKALLDPLGASRAGRAAVECFIECTYKHNGNTLRPDGLIQVTYGNQQPWTAFVEVKTGDNELTAEQVNGYWDLARAEDVDAVITISNEISPGPDVHPTEGLRVRSNSRVKVHHYSWTKILSEAVMVKVHRGVEDVEQRWILGELIRYLEHAKSGTLTFEDMGAHWNAVRDQAREGSLSRRADGISEVAQRWDQLLRYGALDLGAAIGEDVQHVLPRSERADANVRSGHLVDQLCGDGVMSGSLRVPDTAGDLELGADLRAQQIWAMVQLDAPGDRRARPRVTWLTRQLHEAPEDLVVEAWVRNGRTPLASEPLALVREDPNVLLGEDRRREPARFRLVLRAEMGRARRTRGRSLGFVDAVLQLLDTFYERVVQDLTPWQPSAPQVRREPTPDERRPGSDDDGDRGGEDDTASE